MRGVAREQPIQFSHERHVGGNGIDCRYCHTSVEDSKFAGIPPVKTCMNCHAEVFANSPVPEAGARRFETGRSIEWTRVHDLPDFVHFDHSIHVKKGVGCTTCHGPVDRMPLMWQEQSLQMEWCLDCHRNPERFVRPRNAVFSVSYQPPANQAELGRRLVAEYRDSEAHQLFDVSSMKPTDETRGREFWRSLDELADDPAFQERLHNEFPTAVEAITDPVERRTFLKLMGASLGLAGVTACTQAAGRENRSLRAPAGGHHPRQAAVLRHRDDPRRHGDRPAGRESRGASDQDRGQSRPSGEPGRDRRVRAGRGARTSTIPTAPAP